MAMKEQRGSRGFYLAHLNKDVRFQYRFATDDNRIPDPPKSEGGYKIVATHHDVRQDSVFSLWVEVLEVGPNREEVRV